MHVECSSCHARYTIADDKIPIQGARVRCRKCQAVFSVERSTPAAPPAPAELPLIPPTPQAPAPPSTFGDSEFERSTPFQSPPESPGPSPFEPPAQAPSPFAPSSSPFESPVESPATPAPPSQVAPTEIERFANAFASTAPSREVPAAPSPAAPAAAPAPAAPAPAPGGGFQASSGIPEGLPEAERLRHERARRLARVLASDIAIYNKEKRERGVKDGNLVAVLGYEIKKSWEVYKERVTPELANATPYFRDALNDMLAEGKRVF